jgi:hypothetical protein
MDPWPGRLIFHIDADAFFASVEQVSNPKLRGKPVAVCGVPIEKSVVAAASYEAKRYGIKAGMPVFQAKQLLPQGIYVPVNPINTSITPLVCCEFITVLRKESSHPPFQEELEPAKN